MNPIFSKLILKLGQLVTLCYILTSPDLPRLTKSVSLKSSIGSQFSITTKVCI